MTSLCVRCKVGFMASLAIYLSIKYNSWPPPDPDTMLAPNVERCSSWKEALGIQDTVEHYGT